MKEYPDYIFHMKDGKCILQYNKKNGYVYVSYKEIWKFFELYFSMSNQQIKDITKIWVEEHYKMGVKSTQEFGWRLQKEVDEQYKMGVTKTTTLDKTQQEYSVEKHYKMGVKSTMVDYKEITNQVEEQYEVGVKITTTPLSSIYKVEEHYKQI
jgi:hypothetical protein